MPSAKGRGSRSARSSSRSTTSTRPTSSSRSTPTSSPRVPAGCATRVTSPRARGSAGTDGAKTGGEPALRRGMHPVAHRRDGRSSPRRAGARRRHCLQRRSRGLEDRGRAGATIPADSPGMLPGSRPWYATWRTIAARAWSWPARCSRRRSTRWRTRSTLRWATSARRSRCTLRETGDRPIGSARCPTWRATSIAASVDTLLILGANPVYDAPADLNFAAALASNKIGAADSPRPVRGRDRGALPLARPGGALPRDLGRHPGVRRHGDDPAAADRPLVPGASPRTRCSRCSWASRTGPAWRSSATTGSGSRSPATSRSSGRQALRDGRRRRHGGRCEAGQRRSSTRRCHRSGRQPHRRPAGWSSSSGPTRRSGTAGSPTTGGSRSCPSP